MNSRDFALQIIPVDLLNEYKNSFNKLAMQNFDKLHESDSSISSFSFYTSVSAVYSSKIEGENIELDSYIKHKRFGTKYQPDYTKKIDDLYEAYLFAQQTKLYAASLNEAHIHLTKNILQESQQGKFRKGNMYVLTSDGKIEYVAASPDLVKHEMKKLNADIEVLLNTNLSFDEVLFFASMIHLVLVKIHPFEDSNGRISRLAEKWFIAEKLGEKAWFIQSEKLYYEQHQTYYNNIRKLGLEYNDLNYSNALEFLKMLPESLNK